MVKGSGKSSATSATRKKHARKATAASGAQEEPMQKERKPKKEKGAKKKEPRVKMYIPPVKPAPIQPDPLETTGLAHTLPPELLIILRSFTKKAQITKIRALEELQVYIDKRRKGSEDEGSVYQLCEMLPVWLHHLPALLLHPSRRVRLLATNVHTSLLQLPDVQDRMSHNFRHVCSLSQLESIFGSWCLAAHDIDRAVSLTTLKSWTNITTTKHDDGVLFTESLFALTSNFVQRAALDPNGVYFYLNPQPPPPPPPPSKKGSRQKEPEQNSRSKAEASEESEEDRNARLRVGAFGAIRWVLGASCDKPPDDLVEFFKNPALWTSLYYAEHPPFAEIASFGFGQPPVRKAAWGLLQHLLTSWKGHLDTLFPVFSTFILRSAWVEPDTNVHAVMWQPLLTFLKTFSSAWEIDYHHRGPSEEEEESEDEEENGESAMLASKTAAEQNKAPSAAYQEFLHFLESGCSGSPLQGYPSVLVIISTIPSSVMASVSPEDPLAALFSSFWKVLDSRALTSLQRSVTSAALLSSLLECMTFLVKRLRAGNGNEVLLPRALPGSHVLSVEQASQVLASEQVKRAWDEVLSKRLRVESRAAARLIGHTLISLHEIDDGLFRAVWETLSVSVKRGADVDPSMVSTFLKVFHDQTRHVPTLTRATDELLEDVLAVALSDCENRLVNERAEDVAAEGSFPLLVDVFDQFRDALFDNDDFTQRVDDLMARNSLLLLKLSPSLLLTYLSHRKDEEKCRAVWHGVLLSISQAQDVSVASLRPLLDAAQRGALPSCLRPDAGEVDSLFEGLLTEALAGESVQFDFVQRVLQTPDYFLSENGYVRSVDCIVSTFLSSMDLALQDTEFNNFYSLKPLLDFISTLLNHPPRAFPSTNLDAVLPDVFLCVHLFPIYFESAHRAFFDAAEHVWSRWQELSSGDAKGLVEARIREKLKSILCDTQTRPTSNDLLEMLSHPLSGITLKIPNDIFPTQAEIEGMLAELPGDALDPSVAVIDALVPPASAFSKSGSRPQAYDAQGFSSYARIIGTLLHAFIQNRQLAKQNIWALRHFLALKVHAKDYLSVRYADNPVFGSVVTDASLLDLVSRADQLFTYVLTSFSDDGWSKSALTCLSDGKPQDGLSPLSRLLVDAVKKAIEWNSARDCRILKHILQHILPDAGPDETDRWLVLARKLERDAPEVSMTIIYAIVQYGSEPPRLDRYRNELAASVLGIPPGKANVQGLLTLRKLTASAPKVDSDIIFLPQQRAVNLVKACQQWVASDEDIEEEVESAMTSVFMHLAPILQDVPGGHWDFIFDVLENNIENSSLTEDSTLPALANALHLVISITDLTATNKALQAVWQERKTPVMKLIRDLAMVPVDRKMVSEPRSLCRGLVLAIVQTLPDSFIDENTLAKTSHLVTDSSVSVQTMAYSFLQKAAKKHTEFLVIEAGVDSEDTFKAELPTEIIEILQQNFEGGDSESYTIFSCLLGWMLVFDMFQDASLKVRSSYIDQLRNLDMIGSYLMPMIINILSLDQGQSKAFKLDFWAVDEFYVQYFDASTPFSIPVLTAHIYYRALLTVPSLIHNWVLDCKDRQLSASITNYTSQYFSPVIIKTELSRVKGGDAAGQLVDDSFSVKVSTSVNEVTASYLVDEHQLEIKLKIPSDWPLHKIEIKDVQRVGVDENRWRAWILAVQQTLWSHNGRIIDGLGLFKKNLTLHFEGQVECAICYSIISVMDGSLPRKPCKTCRNRFHAACLFKWFKTSHSSSCPLCRSDIF